MNLNSMLFFLLFWGSFSLSAQSFDDYCHKADSLENVLEYEEAIVWIDKALKISSKHAAALHLKSRALYHLQQYDEAIKVAKDFIKQSDNPAEGWMLLGNIESSKGNHRDALELYNKALKYDPKDYIIWYNRGYTYYELGKAYYDKAWDDMQSSMSLNQDYYASYNIRGLLNLKYKKNNERALADFNKAIALKSTDWWSNKNRAVVYKRMKQYKNAIYSYNLTLKCVPPTKEQERDAFYERGMTFAQMGELNNALNDYNKAAQILGYEKDLYTDRASILIDLKKYKEAEADIDRVMEELPDAAVLLNLKGLVCFYTDRDEDAVKWFEQSILADSTLSYPYFNMGNVYAWHNNLEKALYFYKKTIVVDESHWPTYLKMGDLFYDTNKFDESIKNYNIYLENHPNPVISAYNYRGLSYLMLKNYDLALKDFDKAIELNPKNHSAYSNRGELNRRLGDIEAAWKDFEQSIEINPKRGAPYYGMGRIEHDNGHSEKACEYWKKADELGYKYASEELKKHCQ